MKNNSLITTIIVMTVLAVLAFLIAYSKNKQVEGLVATKNITLQVLPVLVLAFIVAGMLQVIIPKELISSWIGHDSGFKGIIIGSLAGGLLPGGPYVTLPLVAGFAKVGASIPVMVAMMTGWSLIAVGRLPMEIGIIGPKLAFIRLGATFILAPIAGLLAQLIVKVFKIG